MRNLVLFFAALTVVSPAAASELSVTVRDAAGQLVDDAVVTIRPASAPPADIRFPWPYLMVQQDISFHPFVLIVPVGAEVRFPNRDKVRHHVYSFSAAKRFQLKLYGKDETRTVVFDKPGVVALGCNIHDRMMAFIDVVETPWAARSEGGKAVISDAPQGAVTLTVWHPFSRAPGGTLSRAITLPAKGEAKETVILDLRPRPAMGKGAMG